MKNEPTVTVARETLDELVAFWSEHGEDIDLGQGATASEESDEGLGAGCVIGLLVIAAGLCFVLARVVVALLLKWINSYSEINAQEPLITSEETASEIENVGAAILVLIGLSIIALREGPDALRAWRWRRRCQLVSSMSLGDAPKISVPAVCQVLLSSQANELLASLDRCTAKSSRLPGAKTDGQRILEKVVDYLSDEDLQEHAEEIAQLERLSKNGSFLEEVSRRLRRTAK